MNNSNEIPEMSAVNPARLVLHRMSNSPFNDVSGNFRNSALSCEKNDQLKEHDNNAETCEQNGENLD